ncbi:MAG: primosomal protein N' [Endomicrobiaceae bacterium]|nr:primosomal protein N' [Endomicrobiaceae bacterium]
MRVIEVVIPIPLNKSFYYTVPAKLDAEKIIDRRIKVSFGNRITTGYAIDIKEISDEKIKFKDIIEVLDNEPVISKEMKEMSGWLSETYLCSVGEALSTIVPISMKIPKRKTSKKNSKKTKIENPNFKVTEYQKESLDKIYDAISVNKNINFLLHGVTGSGKTEIYLRAIQKTLDKNRTAIFLLPEIALTPQFISIIKKRFGDIVALWHSGVSMLQKYKIFDSVRTGDIKIVIGARSAIFLPFTNLGFIVIDEEHESTYKQDNKPCYDAKEIALWRAKYNNAVCVLGSATPAIETYKKSIDGHLKLLELPKRIDNKQMPVIEMISLKDIKNKESVLSNKLISAIKQALARREQIIVFLNRRGFSPTLMCKKCDTVYQCQNCSVSMVYHKKPEILKCHYCGSEVKFPIKCNKCNGKEFAIFGVGTQRVEEELKRILPHAKIFRLDADTAKSKEIYSKVYEGIKNEEYDILLGTQMVAKGFDFSRISLVCVVDADTSLYLPDFRSSEKTFQLITQVAGRCGRADIKGKVLVQTKYLDNYALVNAKQYNYKQFYGQEIEFRQELKYPPFCDIAKVTVRNKDDKKTLDFIKQVYVYLQEKIDKFGYKITLLGPSQAYIAKQNGTYRWQIILKGKKREIKVILEQITDLKIPTETYVNLELDPSDLL